MNIDELQDAFVAGRLQEALDGSRAWLTSHLHLNPQLIAESSSLDLLAADIDVDIATSIIADGIEPVIAIYMQSIFELNMVNEILTLADVLRITTPLPCEVGVMWGAFLAAMGELNQADKFLNRVLDKLRIVIHGPNQGNNDLIALYEKVYETLVTKVYLVDTKCNVRACQRQLDVDDILRETTKAFLIASLELHYEACSRPPAPAPVPKTRTIGGMPRQPTARKAPTASAPMLSNTSTQIMIGAVAFGAVCAVKYRSQIQASAYEVLQAIGEIKGMLLG
ncbi:hypothetical protein THRCLA_06021 [Thraustotheca clavata]|uniref:Uncharacterized protein n=1 Tax=Thraustotheca clavata TaxID=74557 RepID=A0A1V9ZQS0_9STRA|nr:hypothetical protein THRCLA_06021 [Thraustotheca clavata]